MDASTSLQYFNVPLTTSKKNPVRDMLWRWVVMRSVVLSVPLPTSGSGMMNRSAGADGVPPTPRAMNTRRLVRSA